MNQTVVIIGIGEVGSVFARGFLKAGYTVIPVNRQDDIQNLADSTPDPVLVLVAVGENDLATTLDTIPSNWLDKITLLQNELLPKDWSQKGLKNPTVISVWFEKKPGMDYKVLIPSPAHGANSQLIQQALSTLNIPVQIIDNDADMLFELVRKNMYILTTNICGLETGGNVNELWRDHSILMNRVFNDVLEIQQYLTGQVFNRDHLLNEVLTAFEGDPEHRCMGRSAPGRLQRAIQIATEASLTIPQLEIIANSLKEKVS